MADSGTQERNWGKKFGPIRLAIGVTPYNMAVYYLSTLTALSLLTFLPQAQPFILTEILSIPETEQGAISGNLVVLSEIIILLSIGNWGTLSDKVGRRAVYAIGFLLAAVGLYLTPTVTSIFMLYVYRSIFALGAAAITTMMATVVADYAIDADRGKASGIQGVGNGLGASLTVFVFLGLPLVFQEGGSSVTEAARSTYGIIAVIAAASSIIMYFGLQGRTKVQAEQKKSIIQMTREGIQATKDPGIALAYAAAFVSRGDLAIVGTFFTLWGTTYGTTVAGLSAAEALARIGLIIGISQGVSLLTAPIFGIMADRINRVNTVLVAVGISAIGYGSTILVDNPLEGTGIIIVAILIGLGEISGVIASGVLIAQQAPRDIRGSIIGVFSWCGALGILVATGVGGQLFDSWRPQAPFVLFSLFSVMVFIYGFTIRNKVVPLNEEVHGLGGH